MMSRAKAFFEQWTTGYLHDQMRSSACLRPLQMLQALMSDAAEADLSESELQADIGDLYEAVVLAMMNAPSNSVAPLDTPTCGQGSHSAVTAMRLAISYLDGLRDAVGNDIELAADLVLCNLSRQGFVLQYCPSESTGSRATLSRYYGELDTLACEAVELQVDPHDSRASASTTPEAGSHKRH
jgi:hypothetical protein